MDVSVARLDDGRMLTVDGYGVSVQWDDSILRVHGNNRATRIALAGKDHADDVVVPTAAIAAVQFKPAKMLTNGAVTVHTGDGRKYVLHFLKKHQPGMEQLARALGADV